MDTEVLKNRVLDLLEDMKAEDTQCFDVREMTTVTDYMLVAGGASSRHVRSIASHVVDELRAAGTRPHGSEGEEHGEWILIDYGDLVLHVMQPETRAFYHLEKLWNPQALALLRERRERAGD